MKKISVIGLGKLGICFATCLAVKGFKVIGIDINKKIVEKINNGIAPWYEPKLQEYLEICSGKNLFATVEHEKAIIDTDISFILVATPSNKDGSFSNKYIEAVLKKLGELYKRHNKNYHIFIVSSTVMPGSIENSFIPILEKYTKKKVNKDFFVGYVPDFVSLGNVINGFLNPDFVLIGESSREVGDIIEKIFKKLCNNNPQIFRMNIINAELAKVFLNTYITMKISFANSIANLCEVIPGANVDIITNAIGYDKRISPYYFKGGLAFGGTCFPRDIKAYLALAKKYNVQSYIVEAVEKVNKYQNEHLLNIVLKELKNDSKKTISIIGLSFTSNTPVITASPSIFLIENLIKKFKEKLSIIVYDKYAIENTKKVFGSKINYTDNIDEVLIKSDVIVLNIRDENIKKKIESFNFKKEVSIIDCWRILKLSSYKNIKWIPLGVGNNEMRIY